MQILPSVIVSIALGLLLYFFLAPAFLMFAGFAFSLMDGYSIILALVGFLGMFISMVLMFPAMLLNQIIPIAASGQSVSATEASAVAALIWPICYLVIVVCRNRSKNNVQP